MWQIDLFEDRSDRLVIIKPTQVGLTTIAIVRMLWFLRYRVARGMYTFPRRDDVHDFVNSRFEVMVQNSPAIKKIMRGTDNIRMKQIGKSFLHFHEASVPPRMLDVDKLINDEIDLSDPAVLVQYPSRLDASKYKIHHRFSTPTVPGFGIDALYHRSDMKEWMVKCSGCNHWQVLNWEKNLRVDKRTARAWYACTACEKVLAPWDIDKGAWVAQKTDVKTRESGYRISQMMMPRMHPPTRLWELFGEMPLKDFYNLRLGIPFRPPGGSLTRELVLDSCFPDPETNPRDEFEIEFAPEPKQNYYMAYDQGNDLYVIVGKFVNGKMHVVRAEIFPFEEKKGWERIAKLFHTFQPRFMLGDATPNTHSARDLTEEMPTGRAMVGFEGSTTSQWVVNKKKLTVNIGRTEMLDRVRDTVLAGGVQFPGCKEPIHINIATIVDHLTNMERDEVVRKTHSGDKLQGLWRHTGADHFFHVLGHLLIAREIRPTGQFRFNVVGGQTDIEDREELKKSKVWKSIV